MKHIYYLTFTLFFIVSSDLMAQPFELLNINAHPAGRPAIAWGDYDNDGDLDFVLGGITPDGSFLTRIYKNDEGSFVADPAELVGIKDGSAAWGDFDNDNDLDLLITGESESLGDICRIYQNIDGVFTEYESGLPGVGYGDASWGDYDNDGDLDIMIAGSWVVKLYENAEGVFTETDNIFGFLQNAKISWGDFDNDGDLDILLIGDTGGGYFSDVFLNTEGSFLRANLDMTGVISGTADMVDYDNDGDLDIVTTGFNINLEPQFFVYENLGDGSVAPYLTGMEGIATSGVDFGDYDNDGDLDIIMAGKNAACGASIAKVYRNDKGFFVMENTAQLEGAIRCNAAWADYDNDGDLDFLLSGMTLSEYPFTRLYRNEAGSNEYSQNTVPLAPVNPFSQVDGQSVTFSWEKSSDAETPQDGLYYNIRLGLQSGNSEMITPMADVATGYRLIQGLGNMNMQQSWTITGLQEGTYYWSVQAVDHAYAGSPFSEEQSFTIVETAVNEFSQHTEIIMHPNPVVDKIYIRADVLTELNYRIYNVNGQELLNGSANAGDAINVNDLQNGIYFISITTDEIYVTHRFVKK